MADEEEDIDPIQDRVDLIRERLHYRRLGLSGKSLHCLDFEAHIEDDIEWLLEILDGNFEEEAARSEKIEQGIEVIRDEVLRMPSYVENAKTKLQDALTAFNGLSLGAEATQKALEELRVEFDLFRATPEAKLTITLKELEEIKGKLRQEELAHKSTRSNLTFQISALEQEKTKQVEEIKKLKAKLEGLPPTWQERVLRDAGSIPAWVVPGAKVVSIKDSVPGVITSVLIDEIRIGTNIIGEINCPIDLFLSAWKVRSV